MKTTLCSAAGVEITGDSPNTSAETLAVSTVSSAVCVVFMVLV